MSFYGGYHCCGDNDGFGAARVRPACKIDTEYGLCEQPLILWPNEGFNYIDAICAPGDEWPENHPNWPADWDLYNTAWDCHQYWTGGGPTPNSMCLGMPENKIGRAHV